MASQPYIARADIIAVYGEKKIAHLTDADVARSEQMIARASESVGEWIDASLRGRYVLPLKNVPGVVRDIALALVFLELHQHEPSAQVTTKAAEAKERLRTIARGSVVLDLPRIKAQESDGGGCSVAPSRAPVFTPARLRGYVS
ncbi:MAG: phage protein Gp36 family protein [Pseudomonadota bacterium]